MESLATKDIWKQIPPEEKLQMMASAHASGTFAALGYILVLATLSVGFRQPWVFWFALLSAPMIFQFNAGRAWRSHRPRAMLEYLAARTAARRYAFVVKGDDLTIRLMFRGELEHLFESDNLLDELNADIDNKKHRDVWIALFGDSVVMMSERVGGAELQFGCVLDDKLTVLAENTDGRDYSNEKSLILEHTDKAFGTRRVRIRSEYPAALVVFEKRIVQLQHLHIEELKAQPPLE